MTFVFKTCPGADYFQGQCDLPIRSHSRIHNPGILNICKACDPLLFCFHAWIVQVKLFETTAKPLLDSLVAGYNIAIIAYGQTGE